MSLSARAALCLALALPACAFDDADVATDDDAIIGGVNSGALAGILRVTVAGDPDVHTGLLLSPDLVLTSNRWISWSTAASSVTATSGFGGPSPQVRTGRFVNNTWYFPAAITQVAAYTAGHVNSYAVDTRAPAALLDVLLRCYEYDGNHLEYADVRITGVSGNDLTLTSTVGTLENVDAGAVCLDLSTYTAVGMVTGVTGGVAHAYRTGAMAPWLDGMRNLAGTRNASGSTRLALYTRAPNGTRMCLDIPWGSPYDHEAINAYPCPNPPTPNQRFWLDTRVDAARPRLVADTSGRCADIPSSSLASGTNYQQFGCHAGWNQRLELSIWPDAAGGWKIQPAHAPAQNLCLSVEGGPNNASRPTEQRTCTGTSDQRWFPIWNP